MSYFTYILQSETNGQLYIGQTNNLSDRLQRHNTNRNNYTKGCGPWMIIFSKQFDTRSEAILLEMKLKSWKNKEKILEWISLQSG
jgi:putative endonuclease